MKNTQVNQFTQLLTTASELLDIAANLSASGMTHHRGFGTKGIKRRADRTIGGTRTRNIRGRKPGRPAKVTTIPTGTAKKVVA